MCLLVLVLVSVPCAFSVSNCLEWSCWFLSLLKVISFITDLLVCVCFHHIESIWQCLHKSTHLAGWLFCKCKTLISCPLSISGELQENHSLVIIKLFCLFIFNIDGTFGCSSLILVAVGIKLVVWWGINFLARLVPSALVGVFLWSRLVVWYTCTRV